MHCTHQYEHAEGPDYSDRLPGYAQGIAGETACCDITGEACPVAAGAKESDCAAAKESGYLCPKCAAKFNKTYLKRLPDDTLACPECDFEIEGSEWLCDYYTVIIGDLLFKDELNRDLINKIMARNLDELAGKDRALGRVSNA